jgi:hypothetical protein
MLFPQILVMFSIIGVHLYSIMTDQSGDGAADAFTSAKMSSRVVPGSKGNQRHGDAGRSNQTSSNLKFPPAHTACQFVRLCQKSGKQVCLERPGRAVWRGAAICYGVRAAYPNTRSILHRCALEALGNSVTHLLCGCARWRLPWNRAAYFSECRSSLHGGQRPVSVNSLKPWHSTERSVSGSAPWVSEILTALVPNASGQLLIR